jgi:hypothetical protein
MTDTTVIVSSTGTVLTSNSNTELVITGIMGPPGASSISDMLDVDKTELTNGATLVYNSSNAFWKATNKLDNQILEAGQF